MTELRAQVNMRIDADTNISISTTTLSDDLARVGEGQAEANLRTRAGALERGAVDDERVHAR